MNRRRTTSKQKAPLLRITTSYNTTEDSTATYYAAKHSALLHIALLLIKSTPLAFLLQKNFFHSVLQRDEMKFLFGGFWYEPKRHTFHNSFSILIPTAIQAIFWPKASESTVGISIILSPQEMAPFSQRSKTHRKPIWCRIQPKEQFCSLTPAVDTPYSIKLNRRPGLLFKSYIGIPNRW
jgi:hypothetical protein